MMRALFVDTVNCLMLPRPQSFTRSCARPAPSARWPASCPQTRARSLSPWTNPLRAPPPSQASLRPAAAKHAERRPLTPRPLHPPRFPCAGSCIGATCCWFLGLPGLVHIGGNWVTACARTAVRHKYEIEARPCALGAESPPPPPPPPPPRLRPSGPPPRPAASAGVLLPGRRVCGAMLRGVLHHHANGSRGAAAPRCPARRCAPRRLPPPARGLPDPTPATGGGRRTLRGLPADIPADTAWTVCAAAVQVEYRQDMAKKAAASWSGTEMGTMTSAPAAGDMVR